MSAAEVDRILVCFDELCDLVESESELRAFDVVAAELRAVTKSVREDNDVNAKFVTRRAELRIPTRALAVRLMAIIDRIPGPPDDATEQEKLRIASLLSNVAFGFMHAIFEEYDDLIASEDDDD